MLLYVVWELYRFCVYQGHIAVITHRWAHCYYNRDQSDTTCVSKRLILLFIPSSPRMHSLFIFCVDFPLWASIYLALKLLQIQSPMLLLMLAISMGWQRAWKWSHWFCPFVLNEWALWVWSYVLCSASFSSSLFNNALKLNVRVGSSRCLTVSIACLIMHWLECWVGSLVWVLVAMTTLYILTTMW